MRCRFSSSVARVALQGIGQIIDPQELHRPRRRLRPAPRGQLQFIAQRIAGNAAERDPLRRRAAGKGCGCKAQDPCQPEKSLPENMHLTPSCGTLQFSWGSVSDPSCGDICRIATKILPASHVGKRLSRAESRSFDGFHFKSLPRGLGCWQLSCSLWRKSSKDTQGKRRRSMAI